MCAHDNNTSTVSTLDVSSWTPTTTVWAGIPFYEWETKAHGGETACRRWRVPRVQLGFNPGWPQHHPETTLCWTSPYVCLVILFCVYCCCCCYSYRKVINSIQPAFFSEPFVNSCQSCPPPLPTVEYPLKQGHAARSSQWNCRDRDMTLIYCFRVILRLPSELSTDPQWHPLDPGGAHMCPVGCLRSWVPFSLERLSHLSWTLRTWTLLICHFIEWSSVWCFLMIRF